MCEFDELHKLIHSNLTVDSFQSQFATPSVGLEKMELVRIIELYVNQSDLMGFVLLICFLRLPFLSFLFCYHFLMIAGIVYCILGCDLIVLKYSIALLCSNSLCHFLVRFFVRPCCFSFLFCDFFLLSFISFMCGLNRFLVCICLILGVLIHVSSA